MVRIGHSRTPSADAILSAAVFDKCIGSRFFGILDRKTQFVGDFLVQIGYGEGPEGADS